MKKQGKDKKAARKAEPPWTPADDRLNTPFAELDRLLERTHRQVRSKTSSTEAPGRQQEESSGSDSEREGRGDERLFLEAMRDVEPLTGRRPIPRARPPGPLSRPRRRPLLEEELESYAQLVDLVSGGGTFDIRYTDEYVEGAAAGVDARVLRKLRRGGFSTQDHLDLHRMTADEAYRAVERFISASVGRGLRCVLVVHGRGLNSRDQLPILKQRMTSWLKRGRLKRLVLAFATARPCDGGAGALYVLLRKHYTARAPRIITRNGPEK